MPTNNEQKSTPNQKPNDDYDVGYAKPPVETQFKKGQSGNPKGRPPKDKSQRQVALRVLSEKQRLNGQPRGARVLYTGLELVIMTVKQMAAAGHNQATKLLMKFLDRYDSHAHEHREVGYLVVPERRTEEEWEAKYSPKDDLPVDDQ